MGALEWGGAKGLGLRVAEEGDNRKPGEVQGGALGCWGGMGSVDLRTGSQLSSRVSIEAGRGRRDCSLATGAGGERAVGVLKESRG